jgi:hypothetical protein
MPLHSLGALFSQTIHSFIKVICTSGWRPIQLSRTRSSLRNASKPGAEQVREECET